MQKLLSIQNLDQDLSTLMAELREDISAVEQCHQRLTETLKTDEVHYGVNTGFGGMADKQIDADSLGLLQKNIILSHAAGVGELIPRDLTKRMLQLRISSLARGYSGISRETIEFLLTLEARELIPAVPSRGSLGASGDLAPLTHLCLPIIGEGHFWNADGTGTEPTSVVLERENISTVELGAKEGLALINGTQMMAAYGCTVLAKSLTLISLVDVIAAVTLEALAGRKSPFDDRIAQLRPHPGHKLVAENIRNLVDGSEIISKSNGNREVQDPYSVRCVPQVHGATRDAISHAVEVLNREINAVTDNPLIFENGDILSGGNFHGQAIALALDYSAIALAELASISERRIFLLTMGYNDLPKLLVDRPGLNSGFMIPQYTAAALVSENKVLSHPASVDSIPTSLGQEDHVSMGSIAATKLTDIYNNVEQVLAIELLTAAQALDYRAPSKPGRGVELVHQEVRKLITHRHKDRLFSDEMEQCRELVSDNSLIDMLRQENFAIN